MNPVNNNKPVDLSALSFEDQLAIAIAESTAEAATAPAAPVNESQQKTLDAAQDAANKQKEVLKALDAVPAPASASASASSSSSSAAAASSSSTATGEDKDLAAAIKASLESSAPTKAKPSTDEEETWRKQEVTGLDRALITLTRPLLLLLYRNEIPEAAKKQINQIDISTLKTLDDIEKAITPLIDMCEPNEILRVVANHNAKTCFKIYAKDGVRAAIAYAKNPT